MRCETFGHHTNGAFDVANGQMFGANIAERSLAVATLAQNEELVWEMLTVGPSGLPSSLLAGHGQEGEPWRNRLRVRDVRTFPSAGDANSVLIANPPSFSRASEMRKRAGLTPVPICSLVHSVWTVEFAMVYIGCLLQNQPADVFVVSSAAAEASLSAALDTAVELLERSALRINQRRIPRPQIARIPFGIAIPDSESLDRDNARRLLQLPAQAFVALYLGRISEEYKADLAPLLTAARYLALSGTDIHLVVAGQALEPAYMRLLRTMMEGCGLAERIILLENFPDFLKSSLYAAADVCVSPADSIQESFGLGVLEAMAHARPVIASDWSGYRDLVQHGVTGFLVNTQWSSRAAASASQRAFVESARDTAHYVAQHTVLDIDGLLGSLRLLAGNADLRHRMGDAGRQRAQSLFSWPQIADRFLALWASQIAEAKQQPLIHKTTAVLDAVFAHYASRPISPDDLLARLPNTEEVATDDLLHVFGHPCPERVRALIEATALQPVSVGELEQQAFLLDDILWTAKKGFRRLISGEVLREFDA